MQFKVDENLPVEVALLLREFGHDAMTVAEQMLGGKSDQTIARVVRLESRTLITLDLDFADIRSFPPHEYAGLIVLRLFQQDKSSVLDLVRRLIPLLSTEPLSGRLWMVDPVAVRIRSSTE